MTKLNLTYIPIIKLDEEHHLDIEIKRGFEVVYTLLGKHKRALTSKEKSFVEALKLRTLGSEYKKKETQDLSKKIFSEGIAWAYETIESLKVRETLHDFIRLEAEMYNNNTGNK